MEGSSKKRRRDVNSSVKSQPKGKSPSPKTAVSANTVSFMLTEAGWSGEMQRKALRLFRDACNEEDESNFSGETSQTMGVVTFRKVMLSLGVRIERINYYFKAFDRNGSGRLDYREFLLGMAALESASSDTETSNNGERKSSVKSKNNLHSHGSSIGGAAWSQERVRYIFHLYDVGGTGSLSFEDFKRMVRHLRRLSGSDDSPEPVEKEALKSFDGDPTRKITEEEFVHVVYGADQPTFKRVTGLFSAPVSLRSLFDGNFNWRVYSALVEQDNPNPTEENSIQTSTSDKTSKGRISVETKISKPSLPKLKKVANHILSRKKQFQMYTPRIIGHSQLTHAMVNSPRRRHSTTSEESLQDAVSDALVSTSSRDSKSPPPPPPITSSTTISVSNSSIIRLDPYSILAYDNGLVVSSLVASTAMVTNMHLVRDMSPLVKDYGPDQLSLGVIAANRMNKFVFEELLPVAGDKGKAVFKRLKRFHHSPRKRAHRYSISSASETQCDEFEWEIQKRLPCSFVCALVRDVLKLVKSQPTVINAQSPVKMFGDIHGQLHDLLLFFKLYGLPTLTGNGDIDLTQYVFIGDFVDRGSHSVETILLLFSLKILHPNRIWLIRGNHEDREVNENYGFMAECQQKYPEPMSKDALDAAMAAAIQQENESSERYSPSHGIDLGFDPDTACEGDEIYNLIEVVFDHLPLAGVVDDKVLCLHGGLGLGDWTLDDLRAVKRPVRSREIRSDSMLINVLWSDPSRDDEVEGIFKNSRGGDIVTFSRRVVEEFCERENIELIVRAHEPFQQGFHFFAGGRLASVFTARDYCGHHTNDGAFLVLRRDGLVTPRILRSSTQTLSQNLYPLFSGTGKDNLHTEMNNELHTTSNETDCDGVFPPPYSEENSTNKPEIKRCASDPLNDINTRDALEAAGWNASQLARVLTLFKSATYTDDTNSDPDDDIQKHYMDLERFTAVLTLLGVQSKLAQVYFNAMDTSGNGFLDYREFLLGMAALDPANKSKMHTSDDKSEDTDVMHTSDDTSKMHTSDDKSEDTDVMESNIENSEENDVPQATQKAWSKARARFVFRVYDVNHDKKIDFREFCGMLMHKENSSLADVLPRASRIFKQLGLYNTHPENPEIQSTWSPMSEKQFLSIVNKVEVYEEESVSTITTRGRSRKRQKRRKRRQSRTLLQTLSIDELFRAPQSPSQKKLSWPVSRDVSPVRTASNYQLWK